MDAQGFPVDSTSLPRLTRALPSTAAAMEVEWVLVLLKRFPLVAANITAAA